MKVLKTYTRYFTHDTDASLALLRELLGQEPDYRFSMRGLEVTGIGDVCLVGGSEEAIAPIRGSQGPLIVDDLDELQALLRRRGATIIEPETAVETGRMIFAKHPDGEVVEYVEWKPELVSKIIADQ